MLLRFFTCFSISMIYESVARSIIMFVMFSVYVSTSEEELTPRKVLVSLSLINFVRFTSIRFFIICIQQFADARVAWMRMKVSVLYS